MEQNSKVVDLQKILEKYDYSRQKLIFMLHEVQNSSGRNYISQEVAREIAKEMNIPLAEVYEVITFYSMFNETPRGKYVIEVCKSGPCFVRSSEKVVDYLEEILGIKPGEITSDEIFSVETVSCIGACDISPAIKIGEEVYGNLTKEKLSDIIASYREGRVC